MKNCPKCLAKTFSTFGQQSIFGADGLVCSNCGTRVRAKVFGLAMAIPGALVALMMYLLWFSGAHLMAKVGVVAFEFAFAFALLLLWPLTVHPWETVSPGSKEIQ